MIFRCKGKLIDSSADSFGRKIEARGVTLSRFKKNPVVLMWHDSRKIPVGEATKLTITADNCMSVEFFIDGDMLPPDLLAAMKKRRMRCLSSGLNIMLGGYMYNPTTQEELLSKTELTEVSVVTLGRNKECLFEVVSEEEKEGDGNDSV